MTVTVVCPLCLDEAPVDERRFRAAATFHCDRCGVTVRWAKSRGRIRTSTDAARQEVDQLAAEVCGDEAGQFWATRRRSLGMRTPAEALAAGDIEAVRAVLIKALDGFAG